MEKDSVLYAIKLPASTGRFPLAEGYYGPYMKGSVANPYIYCRVASVEKAWKFTKKQAIRIIDQMRGKGYNAVAEPSFSITLNY